MNEDGQLEETSFAELFGDHDSLLVYTMMFGPDWDAACPSCTSIVDAIDANYVPVRHECAVAIVAAPGPGTTNWVVPPLTWKPQARGGPGAAAGAMANRPTLPAGALEMSST